MQLQSLLAVCTVLFDASFTSALRGDTYIAYIRPCMDLVGAKPANQILMQVGDLNAGGKSADQQSVYR